MDDASEAVELAKAILGGGVPLFLGCRQMARLLMDMEADDKWPFTAFLAVMSESDAFPTDPADRANWNPQRLAEKDAELAQHVPRFQQ